MSDLSFDVELRWSETEGKGVGEIQTDGAATPLFSQDITSSSSVYDGTKISIAKMWHDLNLPPAKYWLRLRATDTIKKQTVVSSTRFEVEEHQ